MTEAVRASRARRPNEAARDPRARGFARRSRPISGRRASSMPAGAGDRAVSVIFLVRRRRTVATDGRARAVPRGAALERARRSLNRRTLDRENDREQKDDDRARRCRERGTWPVPVDMSAASRHLPFARASGVASGSDRPAQLVDRRSTFVLGAQPVESLAWPLRVAKSKGVCPMRHTGERRKSTQCAA